MTKEREAPKLRLYRRFDRKAALASLKKRHPEMDRQAKIIRANKKVGGEILKSIINI